MNERKNIDRLFQERFKDFEVVPDDKIWNHIHAELHPDKKRRVLPLWWKLSGIAAGLVLAFFAFTTLSEDFSSTPSVVIAPKEIENKNIPKLDQSTENENSVAVENSDLTKKESVINDSIKNQKSVVVENDHLSIEKSANKKEGTTLNIVQNSTNNNANRIGSSNKKNNILKKNAIVTNSTSKSELVPSDDKDDLKSGVANNAISKSTLKENTIETTTGTLESNKQTVANQNNSITKNKIQIEKDSTTLAVSNTPNPLEELLKKKNEKEKVVAAAKVNRWQVTTNVAPVYFNSASNGSPIEAQFEENSKSYENNLSVGVGVQYAVNTKLAVRTGVNKVSLGYGTNDVVFFGGLNSSGVSNLSANEATSNIKVFSAGNSVALRPFEDNLQNTESGVLNQRMGYYEVPLELSYAVVNRKFGVRVIGGLSTLFLNENSVSVQSATTKMSLGKAENLNDIHFSGNAGIGFNYQFWNSFEAHFEPTLKYQFNTFSRDAGNFKPYFVGLYTGISFKF